MSELQRQSHALESALSDALCKCDQIICVPSGSSPIDAATASEIALAVLNGHGSIDPKHEMQAMAHERVGMNHHRIAVIQQTNVCLDPVLPVLERLPGAGAYAAKKCKPPAAISAMKPASPQQQVGWAEKPSIQHDA